MNLNRYENSQSNGQILLEYFVLFAVVAMLTIIGLTRFDDEIRASLNRFIQAATNALTQQEGRDAT